MAVSIYPMTAMRPALLEYNADTPTALFETGGLPMEVARTGNRTQIFWREDADQFNSLHERLIEAWKKASARAARYFSPDDDNSGRCRPVEYLEDCAHPGRTRHHGIADRGYRNWDKHA